MKRKTHVNLIFCLNIITCLEFVSFWGKWIWPECWMVNNWSSLVWEYYLEPTCIRRVFHFIYAPFKTFIWHQQLYARLWKCSTISSPSSILKCCPLNPLLSVALFSNCVHLSHKLDQRIICQLKQIVNTGPTHDTAHSHFVKCLSLGEGAKK